MTKAEYLDELRDIRSKIEAKNHEIVEGLAGDQAKIDAFQIARAELSARISAAEREQLGAIVAALDAHAVELDSAITGLKGDLETLDDVVKAVDTFTTLVALAARIAAAA